jgi:hypothetical protein
MKPLNPAAATTACCYAGDCSAQLPRAEAAMLLAPLMCASRRLTIASRSSVETGDDLFTPTVEERIEGVFELLDERHARGD